jgi:hypothetical protein
VNAIGIVSCVGFVALLVAGGWLSRYRDGQISGWDRLGRRYPAGPGPVGAGFTRVSVCLNGRWYNDSADVRIGGGGLRVCLPSVFRPYHRPLLLPWDDMAAGDTTIDGQLPLAVGDSGTITLTGRAAERAARVLARCHSRNSSST